MSGRSLRPRREAVYTEPNPDLESPLPPAEPRREGLRARLEIVEGGGPSTSRPRHPSGAAAAVGGAGSSGGRVVPQRGGQRSARGARIAVSSEPNARSALGASTGDIMRGLWALESLEDPPDTPPDSPPLSAEGGPSIVVSLRSPGGKAVGWAEMPEEMLERVLRLLLGGTSHQRTHTRRRISGALRSVCAAWRRIHDALLTSLYVPPPTPDAGVRALARRFANVTALNFKGEYTYQPQVRASPKGIVPACLYQWPSTESHGERAAAHTAALQNLSASGRDTGRRGVELVCVRPTGQENRRRCPLARLYTEP